MIKNDMTPTEAFAFRLANEYAIKRLVHATVISTAVFVAVMIFLSPILIPLTILELLYKGVKAIWFWFFPKPQPEVDETFEKVRAQFRKARRK
jgi:hypothetical protein